MTAKAKDGKIAAELERLRGELAVAAVIAESDAELAFVVDVAAAVDVAVKLSGLPSEEERLGILAMERLTAARAARAARERGEFPPMNPNPKRPRRVEGEADHG